MSYTTYGNYNRTLRARTTQIDSDGFEGCSNRGPPGPSGSPGPPGLDGLVHLGLLDPLEHKVQLDLIYLVILNSHM